MADRTTEWEELGEYDAGSGSGSVNGIGSDNGTSYDTGRNQSETEEISQAPSNLVLEVIDAAEAPKEKGKRGRKPGSKNVNATEGKALAALFVTLFQSLAVSSLGDTARFTKEELDLIQPSLGIILQGMPISISRRLSNWAPVVSLTVGMGMWITRQMEAKTRMAAGEPVRESAAVREAMRYTQPQNVRRNADGSEIITAAPPDDTITSNWGGV